MRASRDPMASRLNGPKRCDRHVRSTVLQIRLEAHMKCIIIYIMEDNVCTFYGLIMSKFYLVDECTYVSDYEWLVSRSHFHQL